MSTQRWLYCSGHDLRFKTRTVASTQHFAGNVDKNGVRCEVVDDPTDAHLPIADVLSGRFCLDCGEELIDLSRPRCRWCSALDEVG